MSLDDGPAPSRRPGAGGKRRGRVTKEEAAARRAAVLGLLSNHVDREEIVMQMQARFNGRPLRDGTPTTPMTKATVMRLVREIEIKFHEQDKEQLPLVRQKQLTRIREALRLAKKDKSWNAVAALERLLAQVTGTLEPPSLTINVNAELRDAVSGVLGQMNPEMIEQLAYEQLALMTHAETHGVDLAKLPHLLTEGHEVPSP